MEYGLDLLLYGGTVRLRKFGEFLPSSSFIPQTLNIMNLKFNANYTLHKNKVDNNRCSKFTQTHSILLYRQFTPNCEKILILILKDSLSNV